ncbi:MAG: hypothetical protein LBM07_02280 [Culturomica sp.]|jgi:hypothetical protein|nr:hypothetical protein [Culturomica sp.]
MTIVIKEIIVRATVEKTVKDTEAWHDEMFNRLRMELSTMMEKYVKREIRSENNKTIER